MGRHRYAETEAYASGEALRLRVHGPPGLPERHLSAVRRTHVCEDSLVVLALIASALVLALVGFDPAGGVLAAAALALGAKSRDVAIFGAAVIGLSAAYGAILSLTIGTRLAHFDWAILLTQNWRRAGIESA